MISMKRWALCGRANAERLAAQMCEETAEDYSVVRTECPLQPIKVVPRDKAAQENVEMEVIVC
jgi:hypothetical protein